jgi:hypothetical protein
VTDAVTELPVASRCARSISPPWRLASVAVLFWLKGILDEQSFVFDFGLALHT